MGCTGVWDFSSCFVLLICHTESKKIQLGSFYSLRTLMCNICVWRIFFRRNDHVPFSRGGWRCLSTSCSFRDAAALMFVLARGIIQGRPSE